MVSTIHHHKPLEKNSPRGGASFNSFPRLAESNQGCGLLEGWGKISPTQKLGFDLTLFTTDHIFGIIPPLETSWLLPKFGNTTQINLEKIGKIIILIKLIFEFFPNPHIWSLQG